MVLNTLDYIDSLDFGMLGAEGEFYAFRLREEARRWIKELENLKDDGIMFSIFGETTVKKPYERKAVVDFIKAFFKTEEHKKEDLGL